MVTPLDRKHSTTNRFPRRSEERGVTVFIVMMTIVLLTGAGTWAMYSAGLTNQASGYSRAAAQAMYTAELGLISGSALLAQPGNADGYYLAAQQSQADAGKTVDACISAADPDSSDSDRPFCKNIAMSDISGTLNAPLLDQTGAEGSMSPFAPTDPAGIEGDFMIEMTEPRPIDIAGEDQANKGMYQQITLSSYGYVRPSNGAAGICGSVAKNAVATMMGMRAHMIIGPLTSQASNNSKGQ